MKKLTKILLALCIAGVALGILFAAGVLQAGDAVGWYMLLPGGAICFGAFMISQMLEKEFALFDAEQEAHPATAGKSTAAKTTATAPLSAKHAH